MLLCLCYQRTCLTTTSTWTSAGKKSPIMCAANPCMGTAQLTQNAAARTARPGASSVLCALPGALVRGATCACMEGGEVPKMPSPCKGGFRKVQSNQSNGPFFHPYCLGMVVESGIREVHCQELSTGTCPCAPFLLRAVSLGIAHQALSNRSWSQLPLSLLPDRGLCSAVQCGPDRSRAGGWRPLPPRLRVWPRA